MPDKIKLIDYLLKGHSRSKAKSLLKHNQVEVNGTVVNQFDFMVDENDLIRIVKASDTNNLKIIYEDSKIIVIDKPSGLLSISDGKEKEKTAYHQVAQYVKSKSRNSKIFVIHRLDRETSGVLMFAKSLAVKKKYQDNWNSLVKVRGYYAIVEGALKNKDTIINYLEESKTKQVYVSKKGKKCITHYKTIKKNNRYSLLDVLIDTGRKNQIRVTLTSLNHPIIGDKKYGSHVNPIQRLGLHAYELSLLNPDTKKLMKFTSELPESFNKIMR